MPAILLAAVAPLALLAAAPAKPRTARCVITVPETPAYRGPCRFLAEADGSFSVDPVGRRTFFPDIGSIGLGIVRPDVGEVRGLTTNGINSRWGEARRSRRDRACWDGADFRICVY
jgi:hypothetical protein